MAYAHVISLMHTIERLTNPTNPQIIKSAYEELEFIRDVLKRLDGSSNSSVINALDAQIREAVCKLAYVVESYLLYRSLPPSDSLTDTGYPRIAPVDEEGMEQEMDSFSKTVKKLGEEYIIDLDKPLPEEEEDDVVSPIDDFGGNKSTTVGLSDQIEKITNDLLVGKTRRLTPVSLVGMAGIGKTHLAREIYQHPIIVQDFDFMAWVRVGPKGQLKNVLLDIVAQIESKPKNLYVGKEIKKLAALLKEGLDGRRYLIVLDDVWSKEISSSLKWWLPDYENYGRVLLTTRLKEVAKIHNSSIHQVLFLNNEESWNLLRQNVFADKSPPPQLERAGRKIAENCEGLPLLILTVADILCGLEKTEEYWMKVADKKTTTFTDAYDKISKVLYTSYEYLPQHLKACFLYMGVFPQSCEIPLPKLINLWAVEDFLEQNLEDFAVECMEKLVSNSIAIVCKQSYNHIIKSSKLHSAYWHLCVIEARKNKFFHVLKFLTDGSKEYIESQCRLSIQNNILFGLKEVYDSMAATLTARSLLCTGPDHEYPVPICFNLMLLKVLDAFEIRFYEFPTEVVKLLQLRYLALTHKGQLPSSISKLQQLQCLILRQHHNIKLLRNSTTLPKEVWDMQGLRHLYIMGSNLPDPSYGAQLPNLITLSVNADSCTEDVFRSMPYLKKLGIKIELQPDGAETLNCFEHIGLLRGLESLKCVVVNPRLRSRVVAPPHHLSNLPRFLRKLSLNGLGYSWEYISAIASLPYLKVLKLRCSAFRGAKWTAKDGEFRRLEFLLLEDMDLVHWNVYGNNYLPRLEHLVIRHCYKLKEIPIRYRKTIQVVDCSPAVVASAQQKDCFDQVEITSSWNL